MKPILTFFVIILIAMAAQCQDSIAVRVLSKPKTIGDTTYYHVRINFIDGTKEKVIVACCCRDKQLRSKGELVMVARKDLLLND